MTLIACGINHETAELALRERLSIPSDQISSFLSQLLTQNSILEAIVLSTCNRTEIYAEAENAQILLSCLANFCHADLETLKDASYHYDEQNAVRHIMRVACGLDSMVLGEPQILGQVKAAVEIAQAHAALGPQLSRLFQQVFGIAKCVRTHTEVGACPVSVASTAVSLAKEIFPDLSQAKVLLIGAGDTVALTAKHLYAQGVEKILVASRNIEKAQHIADQYLGRAISLKELSDYLPDADIIFTATASTLPILGKGAVESALKKRGNRAMFMVDIAVPRDIEPEVAALENVHLYSIDDLKQVIEANLASRQHAAEKAEEIVAQATQIYMKELRSLSSVNTIRAFRSWVEELREAELAKALQNLKQGIAPEVALRRMANALSNKLMHPPSVKIREASSKGRTEFVEYVHELFDLD